MSERAALTFKKNSLNSNGEALLNLTATDVHARCQRLVPSHGQTARESERQNRSQVSLSVTSSCPAVELIDVPEHHSVFTYLMFP